MKEIEFFKLEDRVLFEAAAAAEIVAAADAAAQDQDFGDGDSQETLSDNAAILNNSPLTNGGAVPAVDPAQLADVDAELSALIDGVAAGNMPNETADVEVTAFTLQTADGTISTDRELVIIDSALKDIDSIVASLRPEQEVLLLQDDNGMAEVNEYLSGKEGSYSAIHFVTHGDDGNIIINEQLINIQNFDAGEWVEIREHLTSDGDIFFYGCNIAGSAEGQSLIGEIASACDAEVAASTDTTGFSGDWDLEYKTGMLETLSVKVNDYRYDLVEPVVNTYAELLDALEKAAQNGGDNTIIINSDITVSEDNIIFIEKDLNLTIQGANDDIDLLGVGNVTFFNFYDDNINDINITIDNVNFNGQNKAFSAVYADGIETLTITNSKFENFTDSAVIQSGGGTESLEITQTDFLNNKTTSFSGGAIYATGVSVSISNSYFCGNTSEYSGGALDIFEAPEISISDTTFEQNSAVNDGGAVNIVIGANGNVKIDNCTFYQNSTAANGTGGTGGALAVSSESSSTVTVSNSTFAKNTAEAEGSAVYFSGEGSASISNTLLIGEGGSVVANEGTGTITLLYSLATSEYGSGIVKGTGASVDANYTHASVFGSNTYSTTTHTIAPDAYHKAAWSGTKIGSGLDQLGVSREAINTLTGLTGKYSIGAVTATAGLIVTQGDYETDYTGSTITPEARLTLTYADGSVINKDVSATLTSSPSPVLAAGDYTITPSAAVVDGIAANANAVYKYVAGTLTVNTWADVTVQDVVINSTYGSVHDLTSSYSFTTLNKNTGNNMDVYVSVEWQIDNTVITAGNYSATGHINASDYADSLTVKSFTVTDANGNDIKSYFSWDLSARSDLNIDRKTVTVTLNALADKVYNGKTDDAVFNGGTVSGAISGEVLSVITAPGSDKGIYNSKNVADAAYATFTVALAAGANTDLANYDLSVNTLRADAVIRRASLTVTIDGSKFVKVYDSTTATEASDNNHSVSGIFAGDDVSVTGSFAYSDKNAGNNKTVTMSGLVLSGADSDNYYLTSDSASDDGAVISKRVLDLNVVVATDKVYDGTVAVDSSVTAGNIVAGDDLHIHSSWVYNSANVAEADVVINTAWQISGADSGNYALPSVEPYNNLAAVITAKEVDTVFQTSEPYFYNCTDQSDTVSAYYVDINGNNVQLEINWNGKTFQNIGNYTVTAVNSDPNYALSGDVVELTMNAPSADPCVVYCEGLYPGNFSVMQGMQANLQIISAGKMLNDNIYTMSYAELVSKTILSYSNMDESTLLSGAGNNVSGYTVSVDTLKNHPFTIDGIVQEISESLIRNSDLTETSALYSGNELFAENSGGELVQMFSPRREALSGNHNPIFVENGFFESDDSVSDYILLPETVYMSSSTLPVDNSAEKGFMNISEVDLRHIRKSGNMKSDLEKLLDELCLA